MHAPRGTRHHDDRLAVVRGARLGIGDYSTGKYTSGPYSGQLYSAFDNASQLAGDTDYQTLTDGGTFDAYPLDTSTFARGADLFFANDTYDAVTTGWTRSAIQVDGANAFGPASAENVCGSGCALPGVPALTVTHTLAPATGDLTINESEPLVKCSPDASTFPPAINTSCTSLYRPA